MSPILVSPRLSKSAKLPHADACPSWPAETFHKNVNLPARAPLTKTTFTLASPASLEALFPLSQVLSPGLQSHFAPEKT